MKIVTWNVNSFKARLNHALNFLKSRAPDILMLQELKGLDFPEEAVKNAGYHAVSVRQKAYNGVAILSKEPATVILETIGDEAARYLEVDYKGIRIINIYLPNGNPWPGEKFDYKLDWMEKLYVRLKELRQKSIPFLVGGDFNVIPEAMDCYDPTAWKEDALYRIETRKAFRKLLHLGLSDAFRIFNLNSHEYTFWDYFAGSWPSNRGIRIDHFLLSPEITDRVVSCTIDKEPRSWEKPSDHTPVILEISG